MELTREIKESISGSVLCWLATVSDKGIPNVSPKEIFNYYGTDKIIVANIASPQTIQNIKQNENVCVSFIDILVQKVFQVKGRAKIIGKTDSEFLKVQLKDLFFEIIKIHLKYLRGIRVVYEHILI